MITLSNGVELSEETVVAALKSQGIDVEPKPKKHQFRVGDVAYHSGVKCPINWRLIVNLNGKLTSVGSRGYNSGSRGQKDFERHNYKFVGRQENLLKETL
jgi:hypothetical protein